MHRQSAFWLLQAVAYITGGMCARVRVPFSCCSAACSNTIDLLCADKETAVSFQNAGVVEAISDVLKAHREDTEVIVFH